MKKQAVWNGKVIAETSEWTNIEGNYYFPAADLKKEYFYDSSTHTVCPWKGTASYYTVNVEGKKNEDAAWYYPETKDAAKHIEGKIAFWKGVEVRDAE